MVDAFVLVKTGTGQSETVVDRIRDLDGISEAHIVAGEYDVIVEVDVPEVYDVLETASTRIQSIDGVTETKTYIALD